MAGAGWRDFVPGEVLTAANVQDYLQDQAVMVFASAAARTSAISSPTEGMVSFLSNTNAIEVYSGTAWVKYVDDVGYGLTPIVPSTVTFVGGSGTTNSKGYITWTTCTKIQIAGVFSSAFTHYRVIMNADVGGTNNLVRCRMMTGTSTEASGSDYILQGVSQEGDLAPAKYNTATPLAELPIGNNHSRYSLDMTVYGPNLAQNTQFTFQSIGLTSTPAHRLNIGGGRHDVGSAYTGISIFNTVGSNSGNIQVFGFNI